MLSISKDRTDLLLFEIESSGFCPYVVGSLDNLEQLLKNLILSKDSWGH